MCSPWSPAKSTSSLRPRCANGGPPWPPTVARWWPTWTSSASSTRPGSARWPLPPGRPPPAADACTVVCARRQIRQLFRLTGLDRGGAFDPDPGRGGRVSDGRGEGRRRPGRVAAGGPAGSRPVVSARQVLPESGTLSGAAGREVRVEERAPPGRACPDVLAAFLEPMQRLAIAEPECRLQPCALLDLGKIQHGIDQARPAPWGDVP